MTIREYAKQRGHKVVGKLVRYPEREKLNETDNKYGRYYFYLDEVGNEYWIDTKDKGVSIVTADGGVM